MKPTNNNYCTMYIVRHGETEWNVAKRMQGHTNSNLTKLGMEQAKARAKSLKNIKFDLAFSSDLIRAKKTAEIISLEHKLVVETTDVLRERFFGELEGKHFKDAQDELRYIFEEYVDEAEKLLLEQKLDKHVLDSVETVDQVLARFTLFLREIAVAYTGKTVLIVCHGGMMMHFIEHLGYMENPHVTNTGYMKLQSDGVDFFIRDTEGITEWTSHE